VPAGLGSRAISEDLAEHLAANGWSTTLTSRSSSRWWRPVDMASTIARARHRFDVAVIDVYSGAAFHWAEMTARLLRGAGKPYVVTLHGGGLPAFAARAPRRFRRFVARAAAVTTPSRYLLELANRVRPDAILLPNPIEPSAYPFRLRSNPAPRLVWLRAFHQQYNPTLAPRVLAALVERHPDVALTMFGADKDGSEGRVRAEAARLGVASRLTLPGAIAKRDVPRAIADADIFLNTTNVDNSPVSVIEAMACGLCIASTNVGGLPFLLEHETDALLVPPNDPDAMANAVHRLLTDPPLAAWLSGGARAKAERFGWADVLPRWERLLRRLAAEARLSHA